MFQGRAVKLQGCNAWGFSRKTCLCAVGEVHDGLCHYKYIYITYMYIVYVSLDIQANTIPSEVFWLANFLGVQMLPSQHVVGRLGIEPIFLGIDVFSVEVVSPFTCFIYSLFFFRGERKGERKGASEISCIKFVYMIHESYTYPGSPSRLFVE